jgi:outer membrane protein OmpA-like peptidoglycan-associated protein
MALSVEAVQPKGATKPVQAGYLYGLRTGLSLVGICLLAGCSSTSSMNPVNWWHRSEGGKIAEDRPPPPGADQPYPAVGTVPNKPAPPDAEALKKLTDSLVADRTNAQHAAQAAPLADPSSPGASPALFGVGTAPPPPPASAAPPPAASAGPSASAEPPVASASLPAAAAPPPAAPAPAPRKPVQSAALEAPPAAAATPPQAAAGPPPELPAAPPPRAPDAPPPPVAAVVPPPMPPATPGISSASIVFVEGSTALSVPAADEVKSFAAARGKGIIVVTGYGDSASSDPSAQSAALGIALARANAIADALKADGVPADAVRVNAEASGRGASLRLLQ